MRRIIWEKRANGREAEVHTLRGGFLLYAWEQGDSKPVIVRKYKDGTEAIVAGYMTLGVTAA